MNGKTLLRYGEEALGGIASADKKFFFDCLDQAAVDFVRQTLCLSNQTQITTVAGRQAYDLPPDFINLYMRDASRRYFIQYVDDAGDDYRPVLTSFEKIVREYETDAKEIPDKFCIIPKTAAEVRITGTATASGAASGGECVLIDSTASLTGNVHARDIIFNSTDESEGVVLSVDSPTQLTTALFYGTENEWSAGDAYVLSPQINYQLYLDSPSEESGHTMTVHYICKPLPVYSDYASWRIPEPSCRAICYEAAFLFKMDYDFEPQRDGYLHQAFIEDIRKHKIEIARRRLQGQRYTTRI